jgi:hemolysin activation/secretion protein
MERMQNALIERGYVTSRVLMPTQIMNKASLEFIFIPGRIRNIRFDSQSSPRATQWNALPAKVGDVVNLREIEQALENFKRVPTAEADIQIAATDPAIAQPGDSDIVIKWQQSLPFRLSLGVDNSGSKVTGRNIGSATFSYDHWWTLNDLFYVSLNHDLGGGDKGERGSRGRVIHYSLPVGYSLLSVTASSNSYYQEVAGINGHSRYAGNADNLELKLSRVAYRDAYRKTTASFALWLRESENQLNDIAIDTQKRRMAGWEAGLQHRESIGSALLELSGSYRRGTGLWGALHAPEELTSTGTSRPQIMRLNAQFSTPFSLASQALRYSLSFSGQLSQTSLVPQDRFAIGSSYTVRGFDEQSFLSAEHGWTIRNEVSRTLGQSPHQLYLGVDHGEVSGQSTKNLIGTQLTGAAVGLRGAIKQLSYDVFAAKPLSKPQGFTTDSCMVGFSLMLAY